MMLESAEAGKSPGVRGGSFAVVSPDVYQLPPGLTRDLGRLEPFLQAIPRSARHTLEFRDPSLLG